MSNRVKFYGKADMVNEYMLEKALPILRQLNTTKEFTNGQDLRNTYLHGTQGKRGADIDLHRVNYYRLLMFVVMAIIKINEELSYNAEHMEKSNT